MKFSEYKTQFTILFAVLLLVVGSVVAALILSNTNFYIKNLGTSIEQGGKLVNTVTVTGDGKVFAKPDMAEFTVSISEIASTSGEALTNANKKIDAVLNALRGNAIDANDIQTSQISIYPQYDYNNGSYILRGQRATLSLDVKVKKIDDKATKVSNLIDEISKISNVQISYISFDIEDKATFFTKARTEAFNKAKQKAEELANLSGVKLLKPVSISDATVDVSTPKAFASPAADSRSLESTGATQISTGQLEVNVNLSVIFGIE